MFGRSGGPMPLFALLAVAVAAAPATARYDFLSGGKVVGSLVRTTESRGAVRVEFAYVENGRGPKLVETIRLVPAAQVVAHEAPGTPTTPPKVDERYARQDRTATWKTPADEGSSA